MTPQEAFDVLNSIQNDIHPPTNLAVILNAARCLYLDGTKSPQDIARVLAWGLWVLRRNNEQTLDPIVQDAIVGLEFSFIG